MAVPDVPHSDFSAPLAVQQMVRRLPADLEATRSTRDRVRASPGSEDLSYLDTLIPKPWGAEFRVYEDSLTDVWLLHVGAQHRTSLHCHPEKLTSQLCIEGKGTLTTITGVQYTLEPGVVLHIQPGAYHRIAATSTTGLRLVEIERPKNKFDLLRIEDDYRDVTEPYEGPQHAPLGLITNGRTNTAPLALQPFVELPLGANRRARLRAHCSTGRYGFSVESAEHVKASTNLAYALALEPHDLALRENTVLGPERAVAADPLTVYLTIRVI
jgi:mannose-6-phosphate isomerase-like protein (cupin superfamily)